MPLEFRQDYWDDDSLKKAFIKFLVDIHGLDLSRWGRLGSWDVANYRPFSFFADGVAVSSLCVYSMDMTVQGERCRVAQFSGVGTLPEYRRQGLNLELTRRALKWAEPRHDFSFLFADDGAFAFYKACGFRPVKEHRAAYAVAGTKGLGIVDRLNMENEGHRRMVHECALNREPVSSVLGVHNEKLLMYWCLYGLTDCIYRIKDLNTIVLMKRTGEKLDIFDIVSDKLPTFAELYSYIAEATDREVVFHFMTDRLALDERHIQWSEIETGAHLLGQFPLEKEKFLFPFTAHA